MKWGQVNDLLLHKALRNAKKKRKKRKKKHTHITAQTLVITLTKLPKRCWSHFSGWSVPEVPWGGTRHNARETGTVLSLKQSMGGKRAEGVAVVQADCCRAECWFDKDHSLDVWNWSARLSHDYWSCLLLSVSVIPVASSRVLSKCLKVAWFQPSTPGWSLTVKTKLPESRRTELVGNASVSLLSARHFFSPFLTGEKTQQNSHLSASPSLSVSFSLVSVCVKARGWCHVPSSMPLLLKYLGRDSHLDREPFSPPLPFLDCKKNYTSLYAVQFST